MLPRLHLLVVGVVAGTLALLATAPVAQADPVTSCTQSSSEDQVVRVFPRAATAPGPSGISSELVCGNRYYGLRRIETEWAGAPDPRAAADAAIGRALAGDRAPVYDARSDTWSFNAPGVVVMTRPEGLIIDARPTG